MKRTTILLGMIFLSPCTFAGAIADQFRAGLNGVAWDTSLESLVGMFPQGEHVFSTTPGQRAYWVRDSSEFLGVTRQGQGILYGLDENNRLLSLAIGFDYARKEELLGALLSRFGEFQRTGVKGAQTYYGWKLDEKVSLSLWMSTEPKYGIMWLALHGPNYKAAIERTKEAERNR